MLKDYLGHFANGRLGRRRYVGLWLGIIGFLILAMLLVLVAVGVGVGLAEGELADLPDRVAAELGFPAIAVLIALALVAMVANLNIVAKRARDTGLPGWPVAVVYLLVSGGGSQAGESGSVGGLGLLIMLILAVIPTDQFRRSASTA